MPQPLSLLLKYWKLLFFVGLGGFVVSIIITVLFPLEYRADAQVFIISKSRYGVDPYTVVKSAERVGENIAQVMKTDDFLSKVREQANDKIDWSRFDQLTPREKRRAWKKMIDAGVVFGTGVLNVSAYNQNPNQARELATAVVNTLAAKGWEYVGGDVIIKVVNQPVVTRFPVRPNVAMNAILGFVIGALLTGVLVTKRG